MSQLGQNELSLTNLKQLSSSDSFPVNDLSSSDGGITQCGWMWDGQAEN